MSTILTNRVAKSRVKTAKGRKLSSTHWLQRQINDPYVQQAKIDNYRSRAAYKLIEIDEKFKILKPGSKIIDLGSAPGGWSQVAAKKSNKIIAVDLLEMEPINNVDFIQGDFTDRVSQSLILEKGKVDIVMSDMSPNTSGNQSVDHLRIVSLCEEAFYFAKQVLLPEGSFIAKVFMGGAGSEILKELKDNFKTVKHFKPPASRKKSPETYVIATGFKGIKENE